MQFVKSCKICKIILNAITVLTINNIIMIIIYIIAIGRGYKFVIFFIEHFKPFEYLAWKTKMYT